MTISTAHRADLKPSTLTRPFGWLNARVLVSAVVIVAAIAFITAQQIIHTPWGLPGHRGLFWLSTLIAVRWMVGRPGTALGVGAASSVTILMIDPTMGLHVVSYLVCGFLVDQLAKVRLLQAVPWLMIPIAPVIHCVNLINPFVRQLGLRPFLSVMENMWFYIQGHLMWGLAAGVVGIGVGVGGRWLLSKLPPRQVESTTAPEIEPSGGSDAPAP